jgi:hypothetical protein
VKQAINSVANERIVRNLILGFLQFDFDRDLRKGTK